MSQHSLKRFKILSWSVAISAVLTLQAALGLTLFWAFFDQASPVEILSAPIVVNKTLHPGDTVLVKFDVKKIRDCPGMFHQGLIGSTTYPVGSFRTSLRLGESQEVTLPFEFPQILPPGKYAFRVVMDFSCNPLRMITVIPADAHFEVVPL